MKLFISVLIIGIFFTAMNVSAGTCKAPAYLQICTKNHLKCRYTNTYERKGTCAVWGTGNDDKLCGEIDITITDWPYCDGRAWVTKERWRR